MKRACRDNHSGVHSRPRLSIQPKYACRQCHLLGLSKQIDADRDDDDCSNVHPAGTKLNGIEAQRGYDAYDSCEPGNYSVHDTTNERCTRDTSHSHKTKESDDEAISQ